MTASRIFTIPPEVDFAAALAAGLLADSQERGIPLADYLVFLPTRRAGRIVREQFARLHGGAMLLPRLQPLGDTDEDALAFGEAAAHLELAAEPPAIDPLRRRLLLMNLLRRHHDAHLSADGAWQLAGSLSDLLDDLQRYQIAPEALQQLVPEDYAEHWQHTLTFLRIITQHWPDIVAAQGLLDPVTRHNRLVARQIALWAENPPNMPVIAAGSTASQPATARLLQAIAGLPLGMVILPGLDQAMSAAAWEEIDQTHPQYAIRQWLEMMELPRRFVTVWPHGEKRSSARSALLQTALLPADSTAAWRETSALPSDSAAVQGLELCVAETRAEEAQIIALKLREVLTVPQRTGMLVTRDRQLASRVAQQLRRWEIEIDDSAGQKLAATPVGSFLQLVLAAADPAASGLDFLALLKHPLVALGYAPAECRRLARLAELRLWRGQRLRGTPERHRQALEQMPQPLPAAEAAAITQLLARLTQALQPLSLLLQQAEVSLVALLQAHAEAAEMLAAQEGVAGADIVWRHEAGEKAAALWHDAMIAAEGQNLRMGRDYPALLRCWLDETTVRPAYGLHPRLMILGPLEARLMQADCVILGGMNEEQWPGHAEADPWLSRPMRAACGLPLPENQIGQAAHDFVQLASRGEVLITRARKLDGQPTVSSRFILRLETLLAALGRVIEPARYLSAWAGALDDVPPVPMKKPVPKPKLALRPRRFSITEIGPWRCNPYGFYAKHVLRLRALDELDPELDRADLGILIHDVLHRFMAAYQDVWPGQEQALADLLARGDAALRVYQDDAALYTAWRAQFQALAQWLVRQETARRAANYLPALLEAQAELALQVDAVTYTLVGRADRIDTHDNAVAVIDYKTGHVPSKKEIDSGIAPQLPLLGMMIAAGAFAELPRCSVDQLEHWRLVGRSGKDKVEPVADVRAQIGKARAMLEDMLRHYADETMPYLVVPQPEFVPRYDDYEHLGRIQEWGVAAERAEA